MAAGIFGSARVPPASNMAKRQKIISTRPAPGSVDSTLDRLISSPDILGALAIALLALAAYSPALIAEFNWDDDAVTKNRLVQSWGGLPDIWFHPSRLSNLEQHYWPMVYTSFWLDHKLWGMRPAGFHFVNILLHIANSLLILRLLRRLNISGAWLGAAIFALHPVHVEAVAWVIARKDTLSTLFYLLALLAYVNFEEDKGKKSSYAVSILFFFLAMMSKSIAVTFPAALVIILWWKYGRLDAVKLAPVIPLFISGLAVAALDVRWVRHIIINPPTGLNFPQRILLAASDLSFYFVKVFCPLNLMTIYPRWEISTNSIRFWMILAAVSLAYAILCWMIRRWGRGPLAAALFFGATLSPVLGIIDFDFMNYSFVADRFQYLASAGPIALAAAWLNGLNTGGGTRLRTFRAGIGALLALLFAATFNQAGLYRDEETLFRRNVSRNPDAWVAQEALGFALVSGGRTEEGIEHYLRALKLQPKSVRTMGNLGLAYLLLEKYDEAERWFRQLRELQPDDPDPPANLGIIRMKQDKSDEAIQFFSESLRIRPDNPKALGNLGLVHSKQGKLDEAISELGRAVELDPSLAEAHYHLGRALLEEGRKEEAAASFRRAARLNPQYAGALNDPKLK
ncbi:tetratricopeptide repeat protein [Candidatus Sumerlaeota bacterium]|nr:tetratricopeptide repeat protein [Candidatus Sumerlaeota bacterium]